MAYRVTAETVSRQSDKWHMSGDGPNKDAVTD